MFLSLVVVGNKIDLPRREVDQKLAQGFAKQRKMAGYIETSAKTRQGVVSPRYCSNLYVHVHVYSVCNMYMYMCIVYVTCMYMYMCIVYVTCMYMYMCMYWSASEFKLKYCVDLLLCKTCVVVCLLVLLTLFCISKMMFIC